MTIEFFRNRKVTPTYTHQQFQEDKDDIEDLFPLTPEKLGTLPGANIDWRGVQLPDELIDQIIDRLQTDTDSTGFAITDLHVVHGFRPLYKDANNLWIESGQALHRGLFKRQRLDEETFLPRSLNAATALDTTCPPSNPGDSGLSRDSWYFVYCDMEQAGEEPRIKITTVAPENRTGHGWEHPDQTNWVYLGCFKTEDDSTAAIRPFFRHEDWFYWADVAHGPEQPETDDDDVLDDTAPTAGFVTMDLSDWVPATARAVALTLDFSTAGETRVDLRAIGEAGSYKFDEAQSEHARIVVPVRQRNPSGDFTGTDVEVDAPMPNEAVNMGIVGFQEIQR